jgi:hypothetical protein
MLSQLVKFVLYLAAARFFKVRCRALIYLFITWLILWYAHSEYQTYIQLSGDTRYLWQSSLVKTLLYALSVVIYFFTVEKALWRDSMQPETSKNTPSRSSTASADFKANTEDDGFDFLRGKDKLKMFTDLSRDDSE